MSTDPMEFPPFVPAKPRGGVAAEIAATESVAKGIEGEIKQYHLENIKSKRKRRTAAEMAAVRTDPAGVPLPDTFTVYRKMVELLAGVRKDDRREIIQMLLDYHVE